MVCGRQVPSREVDKAEDKFWTEWNTETKQVNCGRGVGEGKEGMPTSGLAI